MAHELKVPPLGESVSEATVAQWLKKAGDPVSLDEPIVELETDKVKFEINAPVSGVLGTILLPQGSVVSVGKVLGAIHEAATGPQVSPTPSLSSVPPSMSPVPSSPAMPAPAAFAPLSATFPSSDAGPQNQPVGFGGGRGFSAAQPPVFSPAARKIVQEHSIPLDHLQGTGLGGRITKPDVAHMLGGASDIHSAVSSEAKTVETRPLSEPPSPPPPVPPRPSTQMVTQPEKRVPMSRLRQRIAARLKEAQNTAAMLTTFNEIDMSHVMATRDAYRDKFEKRFGIKLGFMSFFVKAAVSALKEIPPVNSEIDGTDIVYKNYYDIGVAVSAPQGLVVPVVRDADHLNFAEIEMMIAQLGEKARTGKLSMEDLSGGTFTITNGGVFGSLMSTPILNPPQSAILGMHKIQQRPVAVDGKVEIRPMMYVALTYDHRVIDGREAVTFLVRIKENIEDPQRILLGI